MLLHDAKRRESSELSSSWKLALLSLTEELVHVYSKETKPRENSLSLSIARKPRENSLSMSIARKPRENSLSMSIARKPRENSLPLSIAVETKPGECGHWPS